MDSCDAPTKKSSTAMWVGLIVLVVLVVLFVWWVWCCNDTGCAPVCCPTSSCPARPTVSGVTFSSGSNAVTVGDGTVQVITGTNLHNVKAVHALLASDGSNANMYGEVANFSVSCDGKKLTYLIPDGGDYVPGDVVAYLLPDANSTDTSAVSASSPLV